MLAMREMNNATGAPPACGNPAKKSPCRASPMLVRLAAGRVTDVGTATAHGHTQAGQGKTEMNTGQQLYAALKTEAHHSIWRVGCFPWRRILHNRTCFRSLL
jgi:hypothetical protein